MSAHRQNKKPAMRNITRFDYGRTSAWWVRHWRGEKQIGRMFSDSKYGGKRAALRYAKAFRDLQEMRLPRTPRERRPPGPGYIRRVMRWYVSNSGRRFRKEAFVAWIRIAPGIAASTSYCVEKWGVRRAKRLCEVWLEEKRREQRSNYPVLSKERHGRTGK